MGIIEQQSIRNSIVQYLGVFISAVSTFLIYSRYKEIYGLYSFLLNGSSLVAPIVSLGASSIATKFHPENYSQHNKIDSLFLFLVLLITLGTLILILLFYFFRSQVESLLIDSGDDPLYQTYLVYIIPLAIVSSFQGLLLTYISNYRRIVISEIIGNLLVRITIPLLVLGVGMNWISLDQYVNGIIVVFGMISLLLLIYLTNFELSLFSWPSFIRDINVIKPILLFGGVSFLNSIGGILAVRIDTLMVAKMIDMTNAGAYTILLFLTNVTLIPMKSIFSISAPIVAKRIDEGDFKEVERVYKSSSMVLLIAGCLISAIIILNVTDVIAILPKSEEFIGFFGVTVFLSLANIFEMTTSLNTNIILYSRYYWTNLLMVLLLAAGNIIFNLVLIPKYGLSGAAISTFLSLTIYNVAKLVLIYFVFRIQPFTRHSISVFFIATLLFGLIYILPVNFSHIVNIIVRSLLFGGVFVWIIYFFSFSSHFNGAIDRYLSSLKKMI